MGLTTEPQHKTAGSQQVTNVNDGVRSKIMNLKYVTTMVMPSVHIQVILYNDVGDKCITVTGLAKTRVNLVFQAQLNLSLILAKLYR